MDQMKNQHQFNLDDWAWINTDEQNQLFGKSYSVYNASIIYNFEFWCDFVVSCLQHIYKKFYQYNWDLGEQ